jgi:hypothetical protein
MNRMLMAVAAVLAGLSGCASPARYVEKSGDVGVVAFPANTDTWPMHYRSEALALIEKHVGPSYEIVHEGEVAVGQRTNNNQQIKREQTFNSSMPFAPAEKDTIDNTTTMHDITEYRITYRKRPVVGGSPLPPGMPGGSSPYAPPPTGGVMPTGGVTQTQYAAPTGGVPGVQPAGGPVPMSATGLNTSMTSGVGGATCTTCPK